MTAVFGTNPVTPPANGSGTSSLTFTASASAATGTFPITVTGTSGALAQHDGQPDRQRRRRSSRPHGDVRRRPAGAVLRHHAGAPCDTGASLVLGHGTSGPEPNQPNTIADSCADGTAGMFHIDESNDRVTRVHDRRQQRSRPARR